MREYSTAHIYHGICFHLRKFSINIRMKIRIYASMNVEHHAAAAGFLTKGFVANGLTDIETIPGSLWQPSDLAAFWGHKRDNIIRLQKSHQKDYLVVERAYLGDRFKWYSLGFNGLNGRAEFHIDHKGNDSSRVKKYWKGILKPWKKIDESLPVLLIGQVSTDASVRDVDIFQWYNNVIDYFEAKKIPVIFRKHPLEPLSDKYVNPWATLDENPQLEDTLKSVRCVVTYSSNSGVISVLEGIPTIAMDKGSMVYKVAANHLADIDYQPDRTEWLNKLSWCQWTEEEIISGEAWKHLKGYLIEKRKNKNVATKRI